jgi:hypothetical protein
MIWIAGLLAAGPLVDSVGGGGGGDSGWDGE